MKRLNFGCGARVADGWTNIDFHPADARVTRVNLLGGFPYPAHAFDAVYSSHVLEHFTRAQARYLLSEAYRVLKPGGVLRIVVPDLEASCREYLNVLALPDGHASKAERYEWVLIELLDQLVRTAPSGEMGPFVHRLRIAGRTELLEYVRSRTENSAFSDPGQVSRQMDIRPLASRLSVSQFVTKFNYWYLRLVASLLPKTLRSMVLVETSVGERHRWMYDAYGLGILLTESGFTQYRQRQHNESDIHGFVQSQLDSNADGTPYKNASIFVECAKPGAPQGGFNHEAAAPARMTTSAMQAVANRL